MSKKSDTEQPNSTASVEQKTKEPKIKDLEQRLLRLERRTKNHERFAHTLSGCLDTQVIAIDAIVDVVRRSLRDDVAIHDELVAAIREYDKHKFHRWFSGFLSVLLWLVSVLVAAFAGAFIYWVFSGQ